MPLLLARALCVCAALMACTVQAQPLPSPCSPSAHGIPPRPAQARGASELVAALAGLSEDHRERTIRQELLAGNLPGFLRRLLPTTLDARRADGRPVRLTLCVLADYLGLGSDDDFLLVPMGLDSALAVAAQFGFTLPTRRIVDLIYQQASVRLLPQPLPAGDRMRSTAYLERHGALVERQRAASGATPGALTAGHKKDLVLSERLWQQPGRVAIYGWQRADGTPIQTLSTVHGARYADYSHGVRLISQTVFVDGRATSIFDVLADVQLAPLLSDEVPLPRAGAWQAAQTDVR